MPESGLPCANAEFPLYRSSSTDDKRPQTNPIPKAVAFQQLIPDSCTPFVFI
jgi:hypothetical protein